MAETAANLHNQGIGFDILDDRGINRLSNHRRLHVPRSTTMPLETLREIKRFSDSGGRVVFYDGQPEFPERDSQREEFAVLIENMDDRRTQTISIERHERRLNIWNGLDPALQGANFQLWYNLSPRWADRYSGLKGLFQRASGYIVRRISH